MKTIYFTSLFVFVMCSTIVTTAQVKEHPAISKYQNAEFVTSQITDYAPYVFGTGPEEEKEFRGYGWYFSKFIDLEGKVTRIQYKVPESEGIYKVYKNYENALRNGGYEIISVISNKESSWPFWNETVYAHESGINSFRGGEFANPMGIDGFWYIAAKGLYKGENIYLAIYINYYDQDIYILQDAIEIQPMESGLVTAVKIGDNIKMDGYVSIYGVYFDSGKSEVKKESEPALNEIAEFLEANTDNTFFIVGHTDNVGGLSFNMELSKNRADAVREYLINNYNVSSDQIVAEGIGPLSPKTSNATEEGKARNRRVEIVIQ